MNKTFATLAAAGAALLLSSTPVHAIDVDAGDYTALPAGTTLGLAYFQHATRDKLYAQGNRRPINARLDSDVGIARGVWFMDIGGYTVDPQFLLPVGRLKAKNDLAALGSESGVGDLMLAATVWFTKPGAKEHFGITPFLFVPIGSYDKNQALNLGENRWKYALQAGWIKPLTSAVTADLIADVTLFGDNKDGNAAGQTLKQDALFQFQGWLRYNFSAQADLRVGLSHVTGGKTKLGGVSQNDKQATTKFAIGSGYFVGPKTQLLATYGRDLQVDNGFKENNRLNLRLLQIF
jgi:hypothetical protein